MNVSGNIMTLAHFADFYYLEALRAHITMAKCAKPEYQFRRAVEKLELDVNEAFEHLSNTMAIRIWVYLWGAALGEATWAHDECNQAIAELPQGEKYTDTFDYFPTEENIEIVKTVFDQDWDDSSYGGYKWLQIVEGMELYGKIPHAAFIDHAVDLEHNGGCVFNKTSERPFLLDCFHKSMTQRQLKDLLDEKFSGNILNTTNSWNVSRKVYSLVLRYHHIIENVTAVHFLRPSLEWLSDYTVTWEYNELTLTDADGGRCRCPRCGELFHEEDLCYLENYDVQYCESCVTRCENCGELTPNGYTQYIDGENETWCDDCAAKHKVTCDECNTDYHDEHTVYTEDDSTLCEECAQKAHCQHCGEYYHSLDDHIEQEHPDELLEEKQENARKREGIFQLTLMGVS